MTIGHKDVFVDLGHERPKARMTACRKNSAKPAFLATALC
jgi:hypothetical protein